MRKSPPILLSVSILLILSLACAVTGVPAPTEDLNFLGTAVMLTMVSGATQTAVPGVPVDPVGSPLPTSTPEAPTATPTATLSPTPVFTATSLIPLISVSVATNCRVGPGRVYDRVGALLVGEVAEIVARNPVGNYWYIRNPDQTNGLCWLWGEYATVTGNFAALPVYTPPPTPTPVPAFDADYDRLETCSGWWVDIDLTNTGGVTFESVALTVRDTDTDIVVSIFSDSFTDLDGCVDSASRDRLNPGANRTVSLSAFTYNPTGHDLRATITLCSNDGQSGTCITETIRFTP
jgi:hypothetical protein